MQTEASVAGKFDATRRFKNVLILVPACVALVGALLVAYWLFSTAVQFVSTSLDVTAAVMPHPILSTRAQPALQDLVGKCDPSRVRAIDVLASTTAATSSANSASSIPISITSCSTDTTSSFPYIGNDIFLDLSHQVFKPGVTLDLRGPCIVYLHPRDLPAFAAVVPQLRHRVVLVSNSNTNECLPWVQGDEHSSWRHHADTVLNSSMVVSW